MSWTLPWRSGPRVLAVERLHVQHLGLLGLVGMRRTLVDLQVAHELALQRPAPEHAADRQLEDPLREFAVVKPARRALLDAAGVARVAVVDLVVGLVAAEHHLLGID